MIFEISIFNIFLHFKAVLSWIYVVTVLLLQEMFVNAKLVFVSRDENERFNFLIRIRMRMRSCVLERIDCLCLALSWLAHFASAVLCNAPVHSNKLYIYIYACIHNKHYSTNSTIVQNMCYKSYVQT